MSNKVHPTVQASVKELLDKYRSRGVDVFVFGSLARTWPDARNGADLDLGYDSRKMPSSASELVAELERDVDELPTIRPVDLVDFADASESFREEAMQHVRWRL